MSDFSIPGVSSKYGTEKLIENLVKVEKSKLTKMETVKKGFQDEKEIWQTMNRRMTTIRDAAKVLYGFNNPFNAKTGVSSDASSLTATATRAAINGEYEVKVITPAKADKFLSSSLPLDQQVPAGDYSFKVGDKETTFSFRGGKLSSFSEALNQKAGPILKSSVVRVSAEAQVFQLESQSVGAKNAVVFNDAAQNLMKTLGVLGTAESATRELTEKALTLAPGDKRSIELPAPVKLTPGLMLETEITLTDLSPQEIQEAHQSAGFRFPEPGSVTLEDVTVFNAPMKGDFTAAPPQPPAADIRDGKVLSFSDGTRTIPLPEVSEASGTQKIRLPLDGLAEKLTALNLVNNNSGRRVDIGPIRIVDTSVAEGLKPLHPVSQAGDAVLEMDGIRIQRDKNTVDDAIPGVTLNLLAPSKDTVKLTVEPDRKAIKDSIINFIGGYNRLLTDILVLTAFPGNDSVLQDAVLSEEERKTASRNLGRFQGDVSLNQLKSSLQKTFMNAYPSGDPAVNLLAQVGISTNSTGTSGQPNPSKLRGYLEMDEAKLDEALGKNVETVRNLFGMDTEGDLIVDSGAALLADEILRPYNELGGFNAAKMSVLDRRIKDKDKEMLDFNDHLAQYELDLKRKYGAMESALSSMQKSFESIGGLGNNKE